jgi:hypothetical protein
LCVGVITLTYALLHSRKMFDFSSQGHFFLWFCFGVPVIIFALPQIPAYMDRLATGDVSGESFIKFAPLWRNDPWVKTGPLLTDLNFFVFWFKALTFLVPCSLLGLFYLDEKQRKLYICFLAVFVMANLINFQPWDKDNNKIFAIWLMAGAGVAVHFLNRLQQRRYLMKVVVVVLFLSMIVSGTLMCIREYHLFWQMYDKEDVRMSDAIKRSTPYDAIFITNESHIHPISNLAGRTVVFGFPGWVHSHGYYGMWERQAELKKFLKRPVVHLDFLKKYNVTHLCWDLRFEAEGHKIDKAWFDSNPKVGEPIYKSSKYTIYDLRNLLI